jgi:hypothetical protein
MPDHTLPLFSLQEETKEIPLSKGFVALVDAADYDFLMQWRWQARRFKKGGGLYAVRTYHGAQDKCFMLFMHRVILNPASGVEIDHIDGNGLNNTRSNLRTATHQQNMYNIGPRSDNASGFKGVSLNKKTQTWQARITVNGKQAHLGCFPSPEDAARAYDKAARVHHGEFAWLNFREGTDTDGN